jgi:2-polyprenyl-3-methyl-5-hydroxy-6-metoxy-1,4-benzoquinol methylase
MSSNEDIQKLRTETLVDFLKGNLEKSSRILDVGCQNGNLCHRLQAQGYQPVGIEIVEQLIDQAKRDYPTIPFKYGDCEQKMPFDDASFDVVWAGDVIEHIRFTDTFVNEINRVLKINGLLILTTPMHNKLKNLIISAYNFEKHFDPEFPHLRFYTLKSLRNILETRGFKVFHVKYLGRIAILAKSMFVAAKKMKNEQVYSKHRF